MTAYRHHVVETASAEQTRCLGHCMGQRMTCGLVLRLYGDLGSGKTCFVQGLARGLAVSPEYDITSPTYTLIHEYPARLAFFHIDLYRIASFADAEAIGLFDILDDGGVVAVEWAERLEDADWPEDSLCLHFTAEKDDRRRITLIGGGLAARNLIDDVLAHYPAYCDNPVKQGV